MEYGWDAVGNKTSIGYPDGSQVDYWYDAENQIVQVQDHEGGITLFEYDPNGNKTYKEYPNNETAVYSYDVCDQIIELDEYDLGGKKHFKTTYTWDAEGNRLTEMQYNHGQSGQGNGNSGNNGNGNGNSGNNGNGNGNGNKGNGNGKNSYEEPGLLEQFASFFGLSAAAPDTAATSAVQPLANAPAMPSATAGTAAGVFLDAVAENAAATNELLMLAAAPQAETPEAETPEAETPDTESNKPETGKEDATTPGNGDGNNQVPGGQTQNPDGSISNPSGHNPPGLNRGDKIDKPANPDKPGQPSNPGTEDKADQKANKGEHIYTYDCLNRMVSSSIAKTYTSYTYDTLGNLTLETVKNKSVDYIYNELNQLVRKTTSTNDVYTYSYDKRGNRIAEIGPKASQEFVFDATNRMVSGTNWKGDESAYTYNGLGIRVNNTHTTHAGQIYARDYVIDYTSFENDDLYVYATGNGQLEYEQLHVYAGSERIEQFTEKGNGNWERTLYVHEDVMGNTRYYTKTNGQSFAELEYDAWGMPASPNKLLNNDHGNYVFATFTGHIYDTTLDIYFAEARFYDANNRQWLSVDPVKDGLNWYLYCGANPTTYWDPTGLFTIPDVSSYSQKLRLCPNDSDGDDDGSGSIWDWLRGLFKNKKSNSLFGGGKTNGTYGAGRKDVLSLTPTPTPTPTSTPAPVRIGEFVGYLAYGAESITQDPNEGFFALYDGPTLLSQSEQFYFIELYEEYGVTPDGALQGFLGPSAAVNREGGVCDYGGQDIIPSEGTLLYEGINRYGIALGPQLQNPNWIPQGDTELDPHDMAYGTAVDVTIVLEGKTYYIPAIIVDVKGHTNPTGIFQTNIDFNGHPLQQQAAVDGVTNNIVEWYTTNNDPYNKSSGLNRFNSTGSVVIYWDEKLE